MVQTLQSFSVVYFTLLWFVNPLHLPSYITPCGEPNLDECAYKSALKAIPHLLKGDKKYHIPVLDPLKLPFVSVDTGTGLYLNISDIVVTGLKDSKLKSLHRYIVGISPATYLVGIQNLRMSPLSPITFLVLCLFLNSVNLLPLPSYIKPCGAKDTNKCAYEHALTAIPHLLKGDKKYRMPVLDPLKISSLQVDTGGESLKLNLTDAEVYGVKESKLLDVKFDIDARHGEFQVKIPKLSVHSNYDISGKILVLTITGHGPCVIDLHDLIFNYVFSWTIEKKNQVEYAVLNTHEFNFTVEKATFQFDNLFNGDKTLGDSMNKFLNENWKDVMQEFGNGVANTLGIIVTDIFSKLYQAVPYNQFFILD